MSEQGDHVIYRVLVFSRDGSEILLTRSSSGLQLPEVSVPEWERVAEKVTSAMESQWGEVVVCLFEPDWLLSDESHRYIVVRHWRTCESSSALLRWIPISDLSDAWFSAPGDMRPVQESLARCRVPSGKTDSSPFTYLTWFEELCEWAGQVIAARGLYLTGGFRQFNASPAFSLIRFETNSTGVWFKAVGEPNEREFPITLEMVRTFPRYSPQFVASRTDWKGWLSLEAEGTNLSQTADLSLWSKAAAALAKLQIESIGGWRPLLDSGAHDLNLALLDKAVSPFFKVIARLMQEQIKIPPSTVSEEGLALLDERIREAISVLKQIEIPNTLGHLDLNPGNVIVGAADGGVFLDWAEAYVGHPFYSFEYLLEQFRRLVSHDPVFEQSLTTAYLAPWMDIVPSESLRECIELAPLVAAFAYAVGGNTWRSPRQLDDPEVAGYLRALARRMNREANRLSERSMPCLS